MYLWWLRAHKWDRKSELPVYKTIKQCGRFSLTTECLVKTQSTKHYYRPALYGSGKEMVISACKYHQHTSKTGFNIQFTYQPYNIIQIWVCVCVNVCVFAFALAHIHLCGTSLVIVVSSSINLKACWFTCSSCDQYNRKATFAKHSYHNVICRKHISDAFVKIFVHNPSINHYTLKMNLCVVNPKPSDDDVRLF